MLGFSSSDMFYSSNGESRDEANKSFIRSKKDSFNNLNKDNIKGKNATFSKEEQEEFLLKCQEFKQQRAATKIQKIWKGFRTRQILSQII